MEQTDRRLGRNARVAAGLAGGAAIAAGAVGTFVLLGAGSWVFAVGAAMGGMAIGKVCLQAAYDGKWQRQLPGPGESPGEG